MKKFLWVILVLLLTSCTNNTNKTNVVSDSARINVIKDTNDNENLNADSKREEEIEKMPIEVMRIRGYRDRNASIEIEFSKELDYEFDPTSYVKVEPSVAFTISKVGKKLVLNGEFKSDTQYVVTVLKGIKASDKSVLEMDYSEKVAFDQKEPRVVFSNQGIILPSVNDKKVYIRTINVNKINVTIKKIYSNNTTEFLRNFNFSGNGNFNYGYDYYDNYGEDEYSNFNNIGDKIYSNTYTIENDIDNWVQTALDLTGILDANGVYMIDVGFGEKDVSYTFPKDTEDYAKRRLFRRNGHITKALLLTDIGIIAEDAKDGIHATIMNIVNNTPLVGAKVMLMSKNNQILEEKETGAAGDVQFSHYKNALYLLVDSNDSKSLLVLNHPLNTNGFDVDGVYVTDGIRGYIYTERGVYRPGDKVHVSIIARNNNDVLDSNLPVKISVFTPTGSKYIEDDVIKEGVKGFYTYSFSTKVYDKTGIWKLIATIGNEKLTKEISVETVVPNRIKVTLNAPESVRYDDNIKWTLNANYLFGAPASGLKYRVEYEGREDAVNFPKYKDYTFKTPSTYIDDYFDSTEGELDENGNATISPDFSKMDFKSLNMIVDVGSRVVDESGRPVITKQYVKVKKFDTYVGIENSIDYKRPGDNLGLKVICVSEDGEKLVANKKLIYRIYNNNYSWWWDYSDYENFIRSFKTDKNTFLLEEKEIMSKDEPYIIDYVVPKAGYMYVEVEDPTTGQIAGINLYADEWADPAVTKKIETLNVSVDKKKYGIGEKAIVKYKGVKGAKALITVERAGNILKQYMRDAGNEEMTEEIEIVKGMAPNAYVYVTLLQDYNTKENDRPIRLYGITPLAVEDKETKIDLEIEAPEQIRPNEKFIVKVRNKELKKIDFTLAVVDEGLLDITNFKTPSPWDYFYKKVANALTLFDNYSEIIGKPYGKVNQILKVGGDDALLDEMARRKRLKELGLEEADRFKPVSLFKGVLSTDDNGEATVDFEMPNYMGSVRIMAVAANEMSFGSAEKTMLVKAPIIIEPTLPRSLKVGDKFEIPVRLFALDSNVDKVNITYTFNGKSQTQTVDLIKNEKKIIYFKDEAPNAVLSEKMTIGIDSSVYKYEETVGMAVNTNNAPIRISENKTLVGKEEATFTQNQNYVKGTVDSILTISSTPVLGLDQRLKYLVNYPYGCVEQTTSAVFPQLFIDKLSTTKNYKKADVIKNINAGILRLNEFQLTNGSFAYWPGEKSTSMWATNYVGQFLINAKRNGYYVPDSMYNNWVNYTVNKVKNINTKKDAFNRSWKAYALYLLALSGNPSISEMNYMYENNFNDINLMSKMYLAAAYKLVGEDKVADNIASKIKPTDIKNVFESYYADDTYYNSTYGSLIRELAVYLDCYHTIYGKAHEEVFNEVLAAMRSKTWYSTQSIGYSLMALANIVEDNDGKEIKGTVDIDGEKTEYVAKGQHRIFINENSKVIKVIPNTDGNTYVNYFWDGSPIEDDAPEYSKGFTLERNYYDNNGVAFDPKTTNNGDSFWIEIIVTPDSRRSNNLDNIALTQILPSGWEIENLRVTDTSYPKWVQDKMKDVKVSYTDIRDDRVMWFFNYRGVKKPYRFYTKVNAVTKGEFDFPGTTLEAMYDNDYRAYKKGFIVKVN